MGRKKNEGMADLDRGINGIVDLDGRVLGRLCVCLHRRRRRWVQDARCDEREVSDAPDPEVATDGSLSRSGGWRPYRRPTTTMEDSPGTEEMQQLQPLLHTEEINSTSVWPIIHMIRAVCFTPLPFVFFV